MGRTVLLLMLLLVPFAGAAEPPASTLGPEGRAFLRLAQEASPVVQCNRCFDKCDQSYGAACHARCRAGICWNLCSRKRNRCNSRCFETVACRSRRRSCEAPTGVSSLASRPWS